MKVHAGADPIEVFAHVHVSKLLVNSEVANEVQTL